MTVDVKLLALLALPLTYLFALLQLGLWFNARRGSAGLRGQLAATHLYWAAANFTGAVGVTLLVSRAQLPLWLATSLGNTLIFGSALILWAGMARFAGHPQPVWRFLLAVVLFFFAFRSLWWVSDDLGMRVLLASITSAVANAGVVMALMRGQQQHRLRTRGFLIVVFVVQILFYLFRAGTAATLDASKDFLQATGIQNVAVTVAAIKLVAWNLGSVVMMRERLRREAAIAAVV